MNLHVLQRQFARIGANLRTDIVPPSDRRFRWGRSDDTFVLDIVQERNGEVYNLAIRADVRDTLTLAAVDVRPAERHLLLMAKQRTPQPSKDKFLCGHDERHWFVSPVPDATSIANVTQAMEALKPSIVRASQRRHGVKRKNRNRRRNAGFVRQGEWFFLPRPNFVPLADLMILRNEPISRTGGKPHLVEEIYRSGGQTVYLCWKYPQGLTESQYLKFVRHNPKAARWNWRVLRANPVVHARGKVRHADHQTLVLPYWHRVVMNTESRVSNVLFLD